MYAFACSGIASASPAGCSIFARLVVASSARDAVRMVFEKQKRLRHAESCFSLFSLGPLDVLPQLVTKNLPE